MGPQARPTHPPSFQFYQNTGTHPFTYYLWLRSRSDSRAEDLQHRPHGPQRLKYSLAFTDKAG